MKDKLIERLTLEVQALKHILVANKIMTDEEWKLIFDLTEKDYRKYQEKKK